MEEQALFVFGGGGDGGDDGGVSAVSGFLRLSFTLTQDNVMSRTSLCFSFQGV